MSPELSLRIRAFHQTNMSGSSNDLYDAFNMSATSQATAGDSPAFRGPYGQNSVTTRQSPPTSGEHEALLANSFSGPANQADEDRIDKLSISFPRTFGPRDPYSRPSTTGPDYHRATTSPNKIDIIVRKALADKALAQKLLALEVGKRTEAQASIQAILGLLQDGMADTMSALKRWELDENSGVQFGIYTPIPLSAQSCGIFIQEGYRYVYQQQQQQSGAAQFSDVFQTPAPDGDPWSLAIGGFVLEKTRAKNGGNGFL